MYLFASVFNVFYGPQGRFTTKDRRGAPCSLLASGTCSAACKRFYALAASQRSTNRRRRKASGGVSNSPTKQTASPPVQARKAPKKTECETEASSNASMARTRDELPSQELDITQLQEDGGGDWFVVASKKKPRAKKA